MPLTAWASLQAKRRRNGREGGQSDETRVRRPARSGMSAPSREGEHGNPAQEFLLSASAFLLTVCLSFSAESSLSPKKSSPVAGQEEQCANRSWELSFFV
jgi:hypothetical protein